MMRAMAVVLFLAVFCVSALQAVVADPLPSWREGESKQAIIRFVESVVREDSPYFVVPEERIAVFDNDGTLWSEKPLYVQLMFAMDRVKALAPEHPEWQSTQPFKAVLENDLDALADSGEEGLLKLIMATHANMTTEEFEAVVGDWLAEAKHPRFKRPYTDLVFQPMLELLAYLRSNGFKTFIVSGGGVEFMGPWVEEVYGIPPEQVVGSTVKTRFEIKDGRPVLVRLPEINFINDKEGKPVGIHQYIRRRPIAAFGNSDGDLAMLQWTAAGDGARFMMLVHHNDAEREYAYDRESHVGRLAKALDVARTEGWSVVNMEKDWEVIYPFELE
jgi:phosphoserine phosphatase